MLLGKYAIERSYFESDESFPDALDPLIGAYEEAARRATSSARYAVRFGGLSALRKAQHWEAVAQTIEECLNVLTYEEREITLPEIPDFGE